MDALSMITKAGAPSNKVVIGVASYGRFFKMMEQTGCDLENCKFTGDNRTSNAAPGRCTGTSGCISNAEIKESIATAGSTGSGRLRVLTFWSITIRSGWRI
jgi:GH18 family chitinase